MVHAGRVQHGDRVERELARAVGVDAGRAIRAPVAARVERHHAEVPRQVRHLGLPEARVDDRPRREQQHGLLALAEHVVGDADAVDLRVAALAWLDRPRGIDDVRDDHHSGARAASA
jgi:hypothetical protein